MGTTEGETRRGRGRHRSRGSTLGRRFDLLWWGQAVSQLGDQVAYLTVPLFVYEILRAQGLGDQAPLPFAITYSLDTTPTLVFGFVGGVLLDRVRLRGLLLVADLARAAAFGYLAWVATGQLTGSTLVVVYVTAFVVGTLSAAYVNGLQAILPLLVPGRQLAAANGRIAATQQAMLALGPLLAGVINSVTGPAPALALNGATYLVSAAALVAIGPVSRSLTLEEGGEAGVVDQALNGLRFLWREPRLRVATLASASGNLALGFIDATFVVMADTVLEARADWQKGVLLAALGVGGVAGAALSSRVSRHLGLGRTMTVGMALFGIGLGVGLRTTFGPWSLAVFVAAFFGLSLLNVALATIRQICTPAVMLGRVITASRAIGWSTLPVGSLLGAALADARVASLGYQTVVRAVPVLLVVTAAWLLATPIWWDAFGEVAGRRVARTGTHRGAGGD